MSLYVSYGLYQTFSSIEEPSQGLSSERKKRFRKKISSLTEEQREAVFMLICEHARQNQEFDYDPENIILPYQMVYDNEGRVDLNINLLPYKLQYILWKFVKMIDKKK
jgi:hypothetical protein